MYTFIRHTSASLTIQENIDPTVMHDLINWLERIAPENDSLYTHTLEGPDDMPAHIKSMLTQTSISIPFSGGRLLPGSLAVIKNAQDRRSRAYFVCH